MMTLTSAAKMSRRPYHHLYSACESGALPGEKNGSTWLVSFEDLFAYCATIPYKPRRLKAADADRQEALPVAVDPQDEPPVHCLGCSLLLKEIHAAVMELRKALNG